MHHLDSNLTGAAGVGVVADATVATFPERTPSPLVSHPEEFPYVFRLSDVRTYDDAIPVTLGRGQNGLYLAESGLPLILADRSTEALAAA